MEPIYRLQNHYSIMRIKIFIIASDEDRKYFNKLKRWLKQGKCGDYQLLITSRDEQRVGMVHAPLTAEQKVKASNVIIVLIGSNTNRHPWLAYHHIAQQTNKRIYYMRIPYTISELPQRLKEVPQLAFNPNAIEKMLRDNISEFETDTIQRQQLYLEKKNAKLNSDL